MSNPLNCSVHLKSTADLKPDARDCMSLKSGLPFIVDAMWKTSPSTTFGVSLRSSSSLWISCLSSIISGKGRRFLTLHLCGFFFSSYHLSGRALLCFFLPPNPTGLLRLKAAVSFILLSTSLYPVLLSRLQPRPPLLFCSTFFCNVIIRRQLSSLCSLCVELISLHWKLSFPLRGYFTVLWIHLSTPLISQLETFMEAI